MCGLDRRLEILGRVPFFAGLSPEDIAAINRRFHEHGYEPGEIIYAAGDPAGRLYVVAAGKVKLLRHSQAGKDVLLDLLIPGEFFGSLAGLGEAEYPDTARAQTTICVLGIGAEDFRSILATYPGVGLKVVDILAARLQEAHERVRQLSALPAEQRIASTLVRLAEKLGERRPEGWLIQTPLSRDDLAEMTGATPETASRVMSQLQKDGLIRTGRQWVAITDRQRLQALAATGF